jgi:transcription initiation factor TFIID TATA-box-binding protein
MMVLARNLKRLNYELKIMKENELRTKKHNYFFKVDNLVATVFLNIKGKIDLLKIARKVVESEYNPEKFPGIVMRVLKPKTTFLIFSTGKMVVTGAKNEFELKTAVKEAIATIRGIGIKIPSYSIEIVNFVASGSLNTPIDLNLATLRLESSLYEPEIFPGLVYYMKNPKAVFLIFSNGKFVCTGAKNEKIVKRAVAKLKNQVESLDIIYEDKEFPIPEELTSF